MPVMMGDTASLSGSYYIMMPVHWQLQVQLAGSARVACGGAASASLTGRLSGTGTALSALAGQWRFKLKPQAASEPECS